MVLVCDIDGTLAVPPKERTEAASRGDWNAYYASDFTRDKPVEANIHQIEALISDGWFVYFVTSRRECARLQTLNWIFDNLPDVSPIGMELVMRQDGDMTPDPAWKVRTIREICPKASATVVWDDRIDVCAQLAALGYVCHQVLGVR